MGNDGVVESKSYQRMDGESQQWQQKRTGKENSRGGSTREREEKLLGKYYRLK